MKTCLKNSTKRKQRYQESLDITAIYRLRKKIINMNLLKNEIKCRHDLPQKLIFSALLDKSVEVFIFFLGHFFLITYYLNIKGKHVILFHTVTHDYRNRPSGSH